jgi:dynein heavy chain 1
LFPLVNNYKPLIKEFPINKLLSATEIDQLVLAVMNIFAHLKRGVRQCNYPILRYLRLVEAIARDLFAKVLSILQKKKLMDLSFEEFDKVSNRMIHFILFYFF